MEIPPEPKDIDDKLLEFLKALMGEDGLTLLNLDNAITAVKQGQPVWQAPFAIGLRALPFLCHFETISHDTEVPIELSLILILLLASQVYSKSGDMTVSNLISSALESLEIQHSILSAEIPGYGSKEEQAHALFHTRFALGVLLLLKGDEKQATTILRQMASTKTTTRGSTTTFGASLGHVDVAMTKALAAIVLQDFYARRQNYELALYLLTEAVASNSSGLFSEDLLAVVPSLLESFADKCERINDFEEWVDLFDRAAGITEMCGEADVSEGLPSVCKPTSPQFLAWKFGQLVARFAVRLDLYPRGGTQLLPDNYYGDDWLNGTVVVSLLCEYDKHRDWQNLRQQYVSMWESLSRYQWFNLCQAGTETDLYWAMRIGFADKMLEIANQVVLNPVQFEPSPIIRDIEMTKDNVSAIRIGQIKQQFDTDKMMELLQKLNERQTPSKQEVHRELQQRLSSVWSKLPAKIIDTLMKAENYYKTGVDTDDAKVWFNRAVEASLNCCLVEPLVGFTQKRDDKRIAVCFSRGVEHKNSYELRRLSLWEWSDVFETLRVPVGKSLASLGAEELRRFMKEHFGELPSPSLRELSRSLQDFCLRKDSAHAHTFRGDEEIQELEQMREIALGIKRPSVITQIFQLFGTER